VSAGIDIWDLADPGSEQTGGQLRDLRAHLAAIEARMVLGSNPFDRSRVPVVDGAPPPKRRAPRMGINDIVAIFAMAAEGVTTSEICRVVRCTHSAARRFRMKRELEGIAMVGVNVCVLSGAIESVERAETKAGKAFARVRFSIVEPRRDGAVKATAEMSAWGKIGEEALTMQRGQEAVLSCRVSPRSWSGKDGTSRISNELTIVSIQTDNKGAAPAPRVERMPEPAARVEAMEEPPF
jgi:single-stranded DNA-binding protein